MPEPPENSLRATASRAHAKQHVPQPKPTAKASGRWVAEAGRADDGARREERGREARPAAADDDDLERRGARQPREHDQERASFVEHGARAQELGGADLDAARR